MFFMFIHSTLSLNSPSTLARHRRDLHVNKMPLKAEYRRFPAMLFISISSKDLSKDKSSTEKKVVVYFAFKTEEMLY